MPRRTTPPATAADLDRVVARLRGLADPKTREGMARYGLPATHALGIPVGTLRTLAKELGPSHDLAAALWDTGIYEARMLTAFLGEPARLTPAQMERWLVETDNWGVCDTLCFHLYDRSAHAVACVHAWAERPEEFVKRGAFALLATLALHRRAPDDALAAGLPLCERAAADPRNFVKKGVSWALRGVGRRSPALHTEAVALSRRLAASEVASARWVGKDALRELTSAAVTAKLAR